MKVYRSGIKVTFSLSSASLFVAFIIHYYLGSEYVFWENVLLGVFGSSLLMLISSIISYFNERKTTLERFYSYTCKILNDINEYDKNASLEDKMLFFTNFHRLDMIEWDMCLGNMCFLYNNEKTFKYMHEEIYTPISELNRAVNLHFNQFRWHLDGNGKNEEVMKIFIKEIEDLIILVEPYKDEFGNTLGTIVRNKIVIDLQEKLYGKYYDIMYFKKIKW